MILGMDSGRQNRRSSRSFLFGSFSFVHCVDGVDNSVHLSWCFPACRRGKIGGEAESFATKGPVKPVPKIPPASLPLRLPSKTVDYLGPKLGFRKSGQATAFCDKEIVA